MVMVTVGSRTIRVRVKRVRVSVGTIKGILKMIGALCLESESERQGFLSFCLTYVKDL